MITQLPSSVSTAPWDWAQATDHGMGAKTGQRAGRQPTTITAEAVTR